MQDKCQARFKYELRHYDRHGNLVSVDEALNLIPDVGRDYMVGALWGSTTKVQDWYMGVFSEAGYTPAYSDDAQFLANNAGELTSHAASRPVFDAALSGGSWGNSASPVTITATGAMEVRGAFISSAASFNSTVGTILSTVKAPSAKVLAAGESLTITATITLLT